MTYLEKAGTFAYVILQHYQEIMAQPDVKSMKRLAEKFIRAEAKLQGTRAEEFLIYICGSSGHLNSSMNFLLINLRELQTLPVQ